MEKSSQRRRFRLVLDICGFRYRAVALTEDTDEERLDAVDPLLAILPGVRRFTINTGLRHTPAEVHVVEIEAEALDALNAKEVLISRRRRTWRCYYGSAPPR